MRIVAVAFWLGLAAFISFLAFIGDGWPRILECVLASAYTFVAVLYGWPLIAGRWHGLFHMAEPCGLCGHTRKHNQFETGWCNERTIEGLPDPVYSGVVSTGRRCLCDRRKMNEHRITEANRQGRAGAAANFTVPKGSSVFIPSYAAAGANQGLSQFQQALLKLQVPLPSPGQLVAGYGISTGQPTIPEAKWTDETYTGYRAFVLYADAERGVFRLKSVTDFGTVWESDTLHARCAHASMTSAPHPEDMGGHMGACSCGIYLCSEKEAVVRQVFAETLDQQGNQLVMAACAGWGTVIEHEGGMRVEYARIERLWTLSGKPELCDRLAGIYGVPCTNLWEMIK